MSFMDNYNALKKKREQEESSSSGGNSFMDVYNQLKAEREKEEQREKLKREEEIFEELATILSMPTRAQTVIGEDGQVIGISPVVEKTGVFEEGNKWYQGWVDKGAMEDGFSAKNIAKTVLGTMNDNRETVTKAVIDATENLMDAGAHAVGTVGRIFSKDFQQKAYDFAAKDNFKSQETSEKIMHGLNWIDPVGIATNLLVDDTEEASVMGDKSDGLLESIAHMVGSYALGTVGVPVELTMGVNAFAPAFEESKAEGATDTEATISAAISTAGEILSEKLFGGFVSGTGLDDITLKPLIKKISNKLVAGIVNFTGKAVGEGIEEVVADAADKLGDKLTHEKEKTWKEVFASEEAFNDYMTAAVSGVLMGMGGQGVEVGRAKSTGRNYVSGMTDAEESVVNKLVDDEVAKRKEDGKRTSQLKRNKIEAEIIEKMEKGTIELKDIESAMGGESYTTFREEWDKLRSTDDYKALKKAQDEEKALRHEQTVLGNKTNATLAEQAKYNKLTQQLEEKQANIEALQTKLSPEYDKVLDAQKKMRGEVVNKVKDSRLAESYREFDRSKQDYTPDMTKYTNEHAKKTVQNIVDSGLGNNSNAFHRTVDLLAKISADKGVTFTLTSDGNLIGTNHYRPGYKTHGFINDDGDITLNTDSPRRLEVITGHEVGHVLQKAEAYSALSQAVRDYCISKEGIDSYNKRIKSAEETYRGKTNTTAEIEVTNDLLGEYIFNDPDFVNRLSVSDRNVFQRVYDEIKYLCKVATAGSDEARKLAKVKKVFDKAYRENVQGKNTNTKTDAETDTTVDAEGEVMIDPENESDLDYESPTKYSMTVTDPELIDFLENQEHITTYKAMVLIDGKLYPPMASKVKGEDGKYHMTNGREVGEWMQAEEDTTNIKFNDKGIGYYDLKKDDGGTVRAAYNPYEHSSNLVLNDQFEAAYKRDNLVTVECVVPVSEMNGAYKAQYAKDATGMMDWHSGTVASQLTDNKRSVYLSRYLKVTRVLSDAEVAQKYKEIVGDVAVPFNVVSPGLLTELENAGVNIDYDGSPIYQSLQRRAAEREAKKNAISEEQNKNGLDIQGEVQYSLSRDTEFSDKAIEMNIDKNIVPTDVMVAAKEMRGRIASRMNDIKDRGLVGLPEDIEGNTYIANSSYDGTEENTTICPRSLASEAFVDAVSEYLGRPLTVDEQIYISQDLQGRSMTPECTYCYVATDRKAYRAFLGEYINQRNAVIEKLTSNPNADTSRSGELYKNFLNGRKDTNPMYSRFKMWVDTYKNGRPMVDASHLANINKLMGDINSEFGAELKPQIVDAMKYAQSASWAKKRVNYVAYNGHILNWKQDRINKLNSHYGLRMYSFSDFHPAFVLENMQMITDASVRGLKMLGYTKDTDFVEIFAPSGMNINISTFGFETNGTVYENNIIGAEWEKAKELREQHPNVGITFVATNDTLVEWALAQDWIDVVIPYHLVRTGAEVAKAFGYTNYTSESSDTKTKDWAKGDKKSIAPTDHNNDLETYLKALEENHLNPRFERFKDNPNYMKLVNECRQSASESRPVQPVFNEDAAMKALAKLEANGYYQPIGGSVDRMYEIAAEVAEDMSNSIAPTKYSMSKADTSFAESEIQAIQSIGRKSVNNFDSNDIAATEKFAQRYWDEMGTKSPFYRAWFGDWRENDQTPVNVATKQGDTRVDHTNNDTGWVIRNSSQVHNEVKKHHSIKNREAVPYLPYIDEIIENAVLLDTEGIGDKKSDNSLLMHYLYAVADIGNGPEVLKLHVEEMYNPGKKNTGFRAYSLQNIEKAFVAHGGVQGNSPSSRSSATNAVATVADLFALVKSMDAQFAPKSSSLVINPDGTPKLVYHGSGAEFSEFSYDYMSTHGSAEGQGFYFTDKRGMAEGYQTNGTKLLAGYLDIKKPLSDSEVTMKRTELTKLLKAIDPTGDDIVINYDPTGGVGYPSMAWYNRALAATVDSIYKYSESDSEILADIANSGAGTETVVTKAREVLGYDGYIVSGKYDGATVYVAFESNQFKEVGNAGTFDRSDNNFYHSMSLDGEEPNSAIRKRFTDPGYRDPMHDFAPYRDEIAQSNTEDIAPVREDVYESDWEDSINALTDEDVPPVNDMAPPKAITTVQERLEAKIRNTQNELDANRQYREQSYNDYTEEIDRLQAEYDSKQNKNSMAANNLLRRIERAKRMRGNIDADFEKRISDLEKRVEKYQSPEYKRSEQRRSKYDEYKTMWEEMLGDTSTWKDKALGLSYKTTTMRRFLRDVVRDQYGKKDFATADAIYDELETKYDHHEAQLKRESGKLKEPFFNLKLNKHEDTYAHMLGEFRHNPETTLTQEVVDDYYNKHKNHINKAKVDHAIEEARNTFDSLIVRVNEVLREQGMKEIPYRKGYFPHFKNPKQGFLGKLLNWKKVDTEIPTSIAGLTENFNPERSWQSFNKQRKGDSTDYSLYQGLDTYIHGALDWIYHIEDIQKRRSLENHIRYIHSEEGVKARIDEIRANETYDADEAQKQIELVLDEAANPLNNLVTELRARTNTLANKKSSMDRGMEEATNRKIYSTMTNLNNRINANMVVGSISSAMTNFIPIVQSWHQVSPWYTVRGLGDFVRSTIKDDGMVAKSDFLTNRLVAEEKLFQTGWDKVSDKAAFMMNVIDGISSQTVWRSKYLQNKHEGMSEAEAIKDADQFTKNVIAGRSRGNQPTIFESKNPLIKIFTAFQLEVANQYGFMFKDTPQDSKNAARLVKGYAAAFMGAYMYNALFSSLTGRDAAFDPIGIIEDLLRDMGIFDDDEEKESKDVILNLAENIADEMPYISVFTGGGRVPMSSAMPYSGDSTPFKSFLADMENIGEGGLKEFGKELLNPLYYLAMPVGGGQIKKTVEGLSMFSDDHPVAGSYTDSGALRFPVEDTFGNKVKAAMFGQWANKNARDYIENGRKPLSEDQLQEYIDLEMPIADYWEYRDGLNELETLEDKFDYIAGLDASVEQKNIMINNIVDRKEPVDMENYDDFTDYEEFDFYSKNKEKYEFLQENNISYEAYTASEEAKETYDSIYSWVKNYPEKVTVAKAVTDDVIEYKNYTSTLDDIRADKDENGKSISGSAKTKKKKYIFGLDLDEGQKYILFKSEYPADDTYNYEIIDYLNDRDDISAAEMKTILEELGFKVDANGDISWD